MVHSDDTVPARLDLTHRERVLLAGGEHTDEALVLVDAALADEDERVRTTALGALWRQGRLSSAVVIAALGDPAPVVRVRAAQLSVGVGDEVVPDLISRLDDTSHVAVAAIIALADREAVDAVEALLTVAERSEDPLVHEEAVAALGALGDPAGLPVVLAATFGKPALRRRSVAALGGFEGDEVEEALDRLAEDRDWQVRQAVALLRRPPLDAS